MSHAQSRTEGIAKTTINAPIGFFIVTNDFLLNFILLDASGHVGGISALTSRLKGEGDSSSPQLKTFAIPDHEGYHTSILPG